MTESNWIKQLDRLQTEIIDIETDDSGDFEAPFDFGRRVQIPYDTAVDEDYSKVFQFLPEKSYKSERATDTKETFCEPVKFCTEKSISDNNTTTQLVNSNELDYILEQIGNLPKTHFEGASDVIYTPITDRKQRDHDLLKELEQFADKNTEHKKSTNKAPRISNIVEAAYIPPKTVYQDLRKLQGIQELSYIHTGSNAVKGTGDILCPQAASRVSKLSIMSQRITFSSSDSESDDDDHWRENIRQQIKKE